MLSSEYGWTTNEILEITMCELGWRIKKIIERKDSELKLDALLHDKEFKSESGKKESIKVNEEEESAIEKAQREGQERVKKRMER